MHSKRPATAERGGIAGLVTTLMCLLHQLRGKFKDVIIGHVELSLFPDSPSRYTGISREGRSA